MTHSWKNARPGKNAALAGLAALAAVSLAVPGHAQIAGITSAGAGPTQYTLNTNGAGDPASITNNVLQITTQVNSEANSAWYNTPQSDAAFSASYTWTNPSTNQYLADGYTFALQNTGTTALGAAGGSLGFAGGSPANVNDSFGIAFEYFANPYTDIFIGDGVSGSLSPQVDTGLAYYGGPVNVNITYNGAVEAVTLQQGSNSYSTSYHVDLGQALTASTATVGFTGGTGGYNATQQISNFTFTSMAPTTSTLPAGLTDVTAPGDAIVAINGGTAGNPPPAGEGVANAIDNNTGTKYLNFTQAGSGLLVTPSKGSTVVTGVSLTSANNSPERDPASFTLFGSNDGGTTLTQISTGNISFAERFQTQYLTFANTSAYTSYELLFPTLADSSTANSMQIAEIGLLAAAPEPSQFAALGLGLLGLGMLALRARRRIA